MKKTLLLAGVLLALTASTALAAGISISWGNFCWSDAGSSSNLTWACNSNTYTGIRMTCSYKPAETKTNLVATDLYMEGMTEATTVPDWWAMGEGGCRYSGSVVTLSSDGSILPGGCIDVWGGAGGGGIGAYSSNDNLMHINATWAVADPVATDAETEYFSAQFRINTAKTVGTDACTGCNLGACWALNYIQIAYLNEAVPVILDQPYSGGNQVLTWQSSSLNCGAVPSRNTTWGQIKSLYR